MTLFFSLVSYELRITMRQAFSWVTPLVFFIIVICLFPLSIGTHSALLSEIAPGMIWVTALLAVLISIGSLFRTEDEEGSLSLLLLSPYPLSVLVFAKIASYWLTHCLPLICVTPLLGFMLHLPALQVLVLCLTLLLGTPALCLLGAIGAALLVGIRGNGLLLPILIMPLYIPILIFGTSAVLAASQEQPLSAYFAIMGAFTFMSVAMAPILTAVALRMGVSQ